MTTQLNTDQSIFSEIWQYISLFQKWAWLLALTTLLGAVGMYIYDRQQTSIYQSTTLIMVVEPARTQEIVVADYLGSERLLNTYKKIFTTRTLLEEVISLLALDSSAETLKNNIEVAITPETNVLELKVRDSSSTRAAQIANTMIVVLNNQNEELISSRFSTAEENILAHIDSVEEQITRLSNEIAEEQKQQLIQIEDRISELEAQIIDIQGEITELSIILGMYELEQGDNIVVSVAPSDAGRISVLKAKELELSQLQTSLELYQNIYYELTITGSGSVSEQNESFDQRRASLALYQQTYQNLLTDYEQINLARLENESNIVQLDAAIPNPKPVSPEIMQDVALAAAVGLIVGAGMAYLIEMLDDSIKKPEDVSTRHGLLLMGNILHVEEDEGPITLRLPRSPVSEAYRSLRTNIQYASVDNPFETLLVTSPSPRDGKSTVAINLAIVLAQSGLRVTLIDGDLRRPVLHKRLGLLNNRGLTSYFMRDVEALPNYLQAAAGIDGLSVITSGALPPNPSELFMSARMLAILDNLKKTSDIVIIDSPPVLAVTDAAALSPRVDGTLLVVKPGGTKLSAFQQSVGQLRQVGGSLVGVVLNDITDKGMSSYYYKNGYYYQYRDYYGESDATD